MSTVIKIHEKEPVNTSQFTLAKFPFEKFTPVQTSLLDIYNQEANCIVASSTGSGKTVCAELFMAHNVRVNKKKTIYLSPLKSLSQEKINEWLHDQHHFFDCNVSICTGDYRITPARTKELQEADIIIMTSEMLNSLSRNYKAEKNAWLEQVGLIVIDESHQIGDEERGSHLESGIMKFSEMNPAKYVMLSATMPNVDEVGKWVNHLNGKPTYLMESTFRQCALNIHYEPYWDEPSSYEETERRKVHLAVQLVKKYPEDKFICFIHGKRIGATLMRFLESAGVRCEYHNANIDKDKRLKIEKDFREDPALRVVVATSGLSQGLNMPARRVIVLGVHRGLSEVKTQEIIQECGRAGRPSYDKEGDAYILLPRRKFEQHKKRLLEPVYIQSQMLNDKVLAFHIVSEIHHRAIKTIDDVYKWYGRTLAHFQKQQLDIERVEQIMKNLIYSGCIRVEDGEYSTTPIGTVASMFYYSPFDVADLNKNFSNLFKVGMADSDNWLAMALGNIETHRLAIVNTVEKEELDGFINEVFNDKIERTLCPRSFTMGAMRAGYCYKQLLEGFYSKNLSNMMKQLQMDFGRTAEILGAIDTMGSKWGETQFFKDLSLRIAYGVPPELVDLTKIKGIGKVKAGKLFNAGLKSPKDLTVEGVTRALKCSKKVAEEIVGDAKKNKPDIIY